MPLANSVEPWQIHHADTESQSGDADEAASVDESGLTEGEHEIELGEKMGTFQRKQETPMKSVRTCERNFFDDYLLMDVIGTGSYSVCKLARHKATGQQYAVKVINKTLCDCREEVEILLRYGQYPGIVSLKTVYEEADKIYLVLQLLRGGDLLDYMNGKGSLSEEESAAVLKTVATTISYLHENGVVHRDLKPANILFASVDCTPDSVTICDMGFAKQLRADNGLLMTPCYTANYVAPEVLKRQGYDAACDIWSLGVILYIMLSGSGFILPRFYLGVWTLEYGPGNTWLPDPEWTMVQVSNEAKMLVTEMLHIAPQRRPTAAQLIKHPWVNTRTNALYQSQRTVPVSTSVPSYNDQNQMQVTTNGAHLKETVAATFRAIATSPPSSTFRASSHVRAGKEKVP
ncbi:hypothetical protein NQ314_006850 [Rhamnusium bicolor]|uniref:Protein kinase domain-containing protein n=1 Tax=Rhamnusium bicolor TaxID=1586634 RepID=A0AAV8YYC0_9CUCU|nr:hypothetical protein NQ314_006850 [Rhamnusium bicolor]